MELGKSVADAELPDLKGLASELLAAEAPAAALLDQIASLAATIAARTREEARRQLLDGVAAAASAIFPAAVNDLQPRLAQASLDELSNLKGLLDRATDALAAFERADAGLMAARDRGDYAAMAPLALEAGTQKGVLDAARAEIARQLEIDTTAMHAPAAAAPEETVAPVAASSVRAMASEPSPSFAGEGEIVALSSPSDTPTRAAVTGGLPADHIEEPQPDAPESQVERRRLRGLIRQMRGTMDEPA